MITYYQPEVMGLFGLTWPEKIAAFMKKQLKGNAAAKKLSDFWQPGGMNVSIVKNLHNNYMALMAKGNAPVSFEVSPNAAGNGGTMSSGTVQLAATLSSRTNVDVSIVLEFLRALFVLARDGKIPVEKWNPQGYKETTALRKTFKSEHGLLEKVGASAGNTSKIVLTVAGIGVAAYLLSQLRRRGL